jgi:hypothetical protein
MLFTEHDQMICALAPYRPDQPFQISILPGRAERDGPIPDPHCSHPSLERDAKCSVIVTDEIFRRPVTREWARTSPRSSIAVRNIAARQIGLPSQPRIRRDAAHGLQRPSSPMASRAPGFSTRAISATVLDRQRGCDSTMQPLISSLHWAQYSRDTRSRTFQRRGRGFAWPIPDFSLSRDKFKAASSDTHIPTSAVRAARPRSQLGEGRR